MRIGRRAVLAGLGATLAVPVRAAEAAPAGAALDEAAMLPPAEALRRLAGVDAGKLAPGRRLDVQAARSGLAIDAALARSPERLDLRIARTLGDDIRVDAARAKLAAELARLHTRATALFDVVGIRSGSVGERYVRLFAEERDLFADSDAGRTEAVAHMNAALAPMRALAQRLLPNAPAFALDCGVRALTPEEIAAGKNGFRKPPAPGRPGVYVVDLKDIRRRPRWSLPSVVAHELLPGHMIQLGIEGAAAPHPLRLTYAGAFVEGWGVAAEALADRAGLFADPRDRLGHLHWLIFRAARGLADIGIHADGWSVADAQARLAEWQGVPVYFALFDTDCARIAKEPGVRAAEALAWIAIAARRRPLASLLAHGRKRTEQFA